MYKIVLKRIFIVCIITVQVLSLSHASYAETPASPADPVVVPTAPVDPVVVPVPTPVQGPSAPTGADSKAYHYNESTGLWESEKYIWNPITKQAKPKDKPTYSWNPISKRWETVNWRWDAPTGKYVPNKVESPTPPPPGAAVILPAVDGSTSTDPTAHSILPLAKDSNGNLISNSTDTIGAFDLYYNTEISNNINSYARSGDAGVSHNTTGGDAVTGDALTQATVLNMLQSVWSPSTGNITTFTANINGDVTGDLLIDPGKIPTNAADGTTKLTVNATENTTLNNNINLDAASGNASVDHNTTGGDATTGTATAVANVVNLLNSIIGAGDSFVGTININGNLNGDILLPPEMLEQLLASNVPRTSLDTSSLTNSNILAQFNHNTNIANNVTGNAQSGTATLASNTTAGDANSGDASNKVTILNLTGRQIIGQDCLLVFVNVLGEWVGMIMDSPGATSAAIGGGITSSTTNELDAKLNIDENTAINNNINLNALSGNANVSNNTTGGNATSGDAKTAANIANVSNSKLSLGGWFGVLFINVFGNWLGSFGVNTSAGNKPAAPVAESTKPDVQVFKFVPSGAGSATLASVPTTGNLGAGGANVVEEAPAEENEVLSASTDKPVYRGGVTLNTPNNIARYYLSLAFLSLIIMTGGKLFGFLKARKAAAVVSNISNISI